jgi:hypothetical protein
LRKKYFRFPQFGVFIPYGKIGKANLRIGGNMAFGIDSDKVFCTVDVILGSVTTTGFEPFSGKVIGTGFDASRCNT